MALPKLRTSRDQRRQQRLFERNARLSIHDLMTFWGARQLGGRASTTTPILSPPDTVT
jgi:hypothetical protein